MAKRTKRQDSFGNLSQESAQILAARISPLHLANYYRRKFSYRYSMPAHIKLLNKEFTELVSNPDSKDLIINIGPRYGKSEFADVWFPVWYIGKNPYHKIILATHEGSLANKYSLKSRHIMSQIGYEVFGCKLDREVSKDWTVSHEVEPVFDASLNLQDSGGYLALGLQGPTAGRGAHVFIVDDPYKGPTEAFSEAYRNKAYEFIHGVMLNRLEPGGKCVILMHRWHDDDVCGRLLRDYPDRWKVIKLPEIAEPSQEEPDPLGREWGDLLWEKRWSRESVEEKKAGMSEYYWLSLHQQRPPVPGGRMISRDMVLYDPNLPPPIGRPVRAWDLAAGGDCFVAGVKLGWVKQDKIGIYDVIREKFDIGQVYDVVKKTAQMDTGRTVIRVEQEGGSQGALSIEQLKRELRGYDVEGIPKRTNKLVEWQYLSGFFQNDRIILKPGLWSADFVDELVRLPLSPTVDQADACALGCRTLEDLGYTGPRITVL